MLFLQLVEIYGGFLQPLLDELHLRRVRKGLQLYIKHIQIVVHQGADGAAAGLGHVRREVYDGVVPESLSRYLVQRAVCERVRV